MKKLPYSIELNGSGEICSFVQEQTLGLPSDWQLQQTTKAKMMVRLNCIGVKTILNQSFLFLIIDLIMIYFIEPI
jgi:hypothetical protein